MPGVVADDYWAKSEGYGTGDGNLESWPNVTAAPQRSSLNSYQNLVSKTHSINLPVVPPDCLYRTFVCLYFTQMGKLLEAV